MKTYLALLRGVNVGGKGIIKMAELRMALETAGFMNVRTYIQSGNVFFDAEEQDVAELAKQVEHVLEHDFKLPVGVAVFSEAMWRDVIAKAPKTWGQDSTWKHNLIILLRPFTATEAVEAVGELKPGIEALAPGAGVLYQSLSWDKFSRTTGGKLASNPAYKRMTVRSFSTATKLLPLFTPKTV